MKVKYDEGPDAVELDEARLTVERGKAVDVPAELGKRLVDQGWTQVGAGGSKTKNKEA